MFDTNALGPLVVPLRRSCCAFLCLLIAYVLFAAEAFSQGAVVKNNASEPSQELLQFVIPAQGLSTALERFSQITGMAILVDRGLIQGYRSASLMGNFSPKNGLNSLLAGSGLMAIYMGDGFTVKPASLDDEAGRNAIGKGKSLNAASFAVSLQQALTRTLCASGLTRPGSYRAALQLWIDSSGRVPHSRLLASTGDLSRDAVLIEGLRELSIGQAPPSSVKQPVTVLVVPENSVGSMDCKT